MIDAIVFALSVSANFVLIPLVLYQRKTLFELILERDWWRTFAVKVTTELNSCKMREITEGRSKGFDSN